MKKRLIILGCTGSIGTTALSIISEHPELFEVVGLSAHRNVDNLFKVAASYPEAVTALTGAEHPDADYCGQSGLIDMIKETDADMVLHGITGASGLNYSIASLKHGKDLALANKESVVMAGSLLFDLARHHGRTIVPVDSEHSAIFQLMDHTPRRIISKVILTASGGPFRNVPEHRFSQITPEEALHHPTWKMGPKITIDSATLANKGLEVIETSHFFRMNSRDISVVVHPQSLVHSLIETREGSLYAQISATSMKIPILNALTYPDVVDSCIAPFTLAGKSLTFEEPDYKRFPMLSYAFTCLEGSSALPIVYNAVNEQAVGAFLNRFITFTDISRLVGDALTKQWPGRVSSFDEVLEIDRAARSAADEAIQRI